jgi:hypothetical protein
MIKSKILGLFHCVPLKNIDFFDFITSLAHGAIGENGVIRKDWGNGTIAGGLAGPFKAGGAVLAVIV